MAGFRTFATGEVLTAANVNNFLMKQSVMVFADDAARTAALGAEVTEGMLTFNLDTGALEVFDGTDFVPAGAAPTENADTITASDATFAVPAGAQKAGVRITAVGGGGGGGGSGRQTNSAAGAGAAGGATSFGTHVTALGGLGGMGGGSRQNGRAGHSAAVSGNGGGGGGVDDAAPAQDGGSGLGGEIRVVYVDLTSVSTVNVTIGAGGAGGAQAGSGQVGGAGGSGAVLLEY